MKVQQRQTLLGDNTTGNQRFSTLQRPPDFMSSANQQQANSTDTVLNQILTEIKKQNVQSQQNNANSSNQNATNTGTVVGGVTNAGLITPTKEPIQRMTADDIKGMYDAMQQQNEAAIDYTVTQAQQQLERAQEDAQQGYKTQHNQINIDEAQARDAEVLYARARGDRGGITARQYNSIANTAASNRALVEQQRQQLATDTARQIADLRAQGEFEKADNVLQIAQQRLQQLWQLQQYEEGLALDLQNMAMNEANLTGMYNGQKTYAAQEAERAWAYDIAMESIKLGLVPDSGVIAAAGLDVDSVTQMANLYAEINGTADYLGGSRGSSGGGSWGGGGGGGSYSSSSSKTPSVTYDPDVDYQALINEAVASGNTAAAAVYEQQRNAKIADMNKAGTNTGGYKQTNDYSSGLTDYDPDVDYMKLRNEAAASGDLQMAAIYEQLRNAKIAGENISNRRATNKYADYLYGAGIGSSGGGSGSGTGSGSGLGSSGSGSGVTGGDNPNHYTKTYLDKATGQVIGTMQVGDQYIADAALAYLAEQRDAGRTVVLDSQTLDHWLVANGYTGEAGAQFKAHLYDFGVRPSRVAVGR